MLFIDVVIHQFGGRCVLFGYRCKTSNRLCVFGTMFSEFNFTLRTGTVFCELIWSFEIFLDDGKGYHLCLDAAALCLLHGVDARFLLEAVSPFELATLCCYDDWKELDHEGDQVFWQSFQLYFWCNAWNVSFSVELRSFCFSRMF